MTIREAKMLKIVLILFAALVLLYALAALFGPRVFKNSFREEAAGMLEGTKKGKSEIITKEKIQHLPAPVQRYLEYTGMLGKEKIHTLRLKQGGFFRLKPDQGWMPITAEQYFNADRVEFSWLGRVNMGSLLPVQAKDSFLGGRGNLNVKLLGLVPVVDARGPKIDQGEILRFLGETVWFPSAFLSDTISWETTDDRSAKAAIRFQGITGSAVFHFNEKGEVTLIRAKRYMEKEGKFSMQDWEIRLEDYRVFDGLKVPAAAKVMWKLKEGDFIYDRLEINEIEYNVGEVY
jgi:hypothetical protein